MIDLNDAEALIENADQWRQLYTINYRKCQTIDERRQSITTWLPSSVDWPNAEKDIRSIAASTQLTIIAIQQGNRHLGTRVGVVSASCDVQGSFESLCRFLHELNDRPHPIACSEIKLHRTMGSDHEETDTPTPHCRATLSLRLPFAASGTAAGKLLSAETKHAP